MPFPTVPRGKRKLHFIADGEIMQHFFLTHLMVSVKRRALLQKLIILNTEEKKIVFQSTVYLKFQNFFVKQKEATLSFFNQEIKFQSRMLWPSRTARAGKPPQNRLLEGWRYIVLYSYHTMYEACMKHEGLLFIYNSLVICASMT